ncbi:hypothetical protein GX48_04006 [Paracoccidioides brasiliensis]|nr:hypothetical protein GX48_04006 [Paracoccidioides brasiliensis]
MAHLARTTVTASFAFSNNPGSSPGLLASALLQVINVVSIGSPPWHCAVTSLEDYANGEIGDCANGNVGCLG